ncbi:MAG TPA: type III-B CRISPR-associated protein Cas10/Cmr2 [Chloroflexi bacterium]|nr:type III-B CRISPR-associated protein Cas10/Cmr2 [Chloroflexota bacterium]
MTEKHLLIFTIGPVQSFIAEARRTRDLFVGSQLLVELTRAAAYAVDRMQGVEWVYPSHVDQDSLPNRFVAYVPADRVEQVREAAEKAVEDTWAKYADNARKELSKFAPREDKTWKEIWKRQIATFPEVHWTVCRPPSSEQAARLLGGKAPGGHAARHIIASLALNARKGMRQFEHTTEHGEKDTLSGVREPLHTGKLNAKSYWSQVAEGLKNDGNPSLVRPEGRERLDALGAVKRFIPPYNFPEAEKFPSTSSVAAADFRRRIKGNPAAEKALEEHGQEVRKLGIFKPGDGFAAEEIGLAGWEYDGDLLYDSTFTPQALVDDCGLLNVREQDLESARKSLGELYSAANCRPSTYYAILMMDADGMSDKIADCQSLEEHQKISRALSEFAGLVKEIVERQFAGRVIYAGGDDVLALLPVADALPSAAALRGAFRQVLGELLPEATISAGIALVHHRHPLDSALRAAREAQYAAKQIEGKDALCVYALKRSGEPVSVRAKWEYDGIGVVTMIERIRKEFGGPLSSRFAFEVHTEARSLALTRSAHTVPCEALESELRRLLTRHLDPKKVAVSEGEKPGDAVRRVARELAAPLAQLAQALDVHRGNWQKDWCEEHPEHSPDPLDEDYAPQPGALELGKWLLLARFLALGGEE